jgi:hypothetical protein
VSSSSGIWAFMNWDMLCDSLPLLYIYIAPLEIERERERRELFKSTNYYCYYRIIYNKSKWFLFKSMTFFIICK